MQVGTPAITLSIEHKENWSRYIFGNNLEVSVVSKDFISSMLLDGAKIYIFEHNKIGSELYKFLDLPSSHDGVHFGGQFIKGLTHPMYIRRFAILSDIKFNVFYEIQQYNGIFEELPGYHQIRYTEETDKKSIYNLVNEIFLYSKKYELVPTKCLDSKHTFIFIPKQYLQFNLSEHLLLEFKNEKSKPWYTH